MLGGLVLRTKTMLALLSLLFAVMVMEKADAQEDHKNEIGLLLSGTVPPALDAAGGSLEIGIGITFQLTYARRLATSPSVALYFEVPAVAIPLQDIRASNGIISRNYDSFFVTPALRIKLAPQARVSPWFPAGGGYALF